MDSTNEHWEKHHGVTGRRASTHRAPDDLMAAEKAAALHPTRRWPARERVRGAAFFFTTRPARRDQWRPLVSPGLPLHRQRTPECAHMSLPCQHPNLIQSPPR